MPSRARFAATTISSVRPSPSTSAGTTWSAGPTGTAGSPGAAAGTRPSAMFAEQKTTGGSMSTGGRQSAPSKDEKTSRVAPARLDSVTSPTRPSPSGARYPKALRTVLSAGTPGSGSQGFRRKPCCSHQSGRASWTQA